MTNLILNCALYVILSSALPLLVKVYHVPQKTGRIMCSLLSVVQCAKKFFLMDILLRLFLQLYVLLFSN